MLKELALRRATKFYNEHWFVGPSDLTPEQKSLRKSLLNQFRKLEHAVACGHTEKEMLVMVDYVLRSAPEGCLVECGSYLGGSSAKLSLVAAATGRKLFVCDSFEGLPVPKGADGEFVDARSGVGRKFEAGEFAVRRDVVENNVRQWGNYDVCTFVEGFFSDSLPKLVQAQQIKPAFIFADADLVVSTRDVLRLLWPRLASGGRFYTHDAGLIGLCEGIMDGAFWRDELGQFPPILFGAGYGLGFQAGAVAYCQKP